MAGKTNSEQLSVMQDDYSCKEDTNNITSHLKITSGHVFTMSRAETILKYSTCKVNFPHVFKI